MAAAASSSHALDSMMDERVYAHLTDCIDDAPSVAELDAVRHLLAATAMREAERRALERRVRLRARVLRGGDALVVRAPAIRAD
jgi:hypothetical protein